MTRSARSLAHTRHGHTAGKVYSPTYVSWQAMLARCRYPERDRNNMWATKGVTVCDRWKNSFEAFLDDMGNRPEGKTLDRYPDRDGNYEPGNCRWATPQEQARNTRHTVLAFDTAVEVAIARLKGETCPSLSARFGISESLPREIVKGRCWPDALLAVKQSIATENEKHAE